MQTILTRLDEITKNFKDILKNKEAELIENIEKGNFISLEKEIKELTDNCKFSMQVRRPADSRF